MTTSQRRETGQQLLERAAQMKEAVEQMLPSANTKSERVLLKVSSDLVYQIALVVSNTLRHSHTVPPFEAAGVNAMIDAVADAYRELTGKSVW